MKSSPVIPVNEQVSWIGSLDEDLVTFDIVMETDAGTTYNSYLVNADQKAVIDTVKAPFAKEYLDKIREICDPSEIRYIICNHTEPDHSGCLQTLLEHAPDATVVGSGQALNYLGEMLSIPFHARKVKDGDQLDLGNKTLRFIGAANLHWPDTIYTYLEEDGLLFTCDSFGAHYCHDAMFDDLTDNYQEAFDYYFDVILKPFSKFMLKAIDKIRELDIEMICPGHGPILRQSWGDKVERSASLARDYLADLKADARKVLVTYVSAYGYTREMAESIAEGIRSSSDATVEMVDLEHLPLGEMESLMVQSGGLLIGSPTINRNTLLPVYKLFSVVNPIRDKGKLAAAFGSYGWSGEAVPLVESHLRNLKFEIVQDGLAAKFQPDPEVKSELVEFGRTFGLRFSELQSQA